ncbi:MAG: SPOR domain-containing protein [Glaciimonas sp.]|nr:SPOR domain-containing protein [Glaciimonas sp.]
MSKLGKHKKKQFGGTLLGLILGLIVGLGIAVFVAIMITKTPTPFTNKVAKSEKASETITMPEQLSDPNKPLYGNRSQHVTPVTPSVPATTALVPPAVVPELPAKSPTAQKTLDLIGQKIEEKQHETKAPIIGTSTFDKTKKAAVDIASAKAVSGDDQWIYYLQVGAFREQAEADSARAKLALQGFEARISECPSDNGSLYRVRIGAFSSLEAMNHMRARLSDNGIDTAVVRSAK